MTIKAATKLAIVGVALGLLFGFVYPFAIRWIAYGWTAEQTSNAYSACRSIQLLLSEGSLLLFLIVLGSKQKEQP